MQRQPPLIKLIQKTWETMKPYNSYNEIIPLRETKVQATLVVFLIQDVKIHHLRLSFVLYHCAIPITLKKLACHITLHF